MLIRAFAYIYKKHKDYKLIIYGNGSMKEELKTYASQLLPRRSFVFESASEEILKKINDAGIFVLSSDYEGLPNALIEAMAIGLPCVSTDCPSGGPRMLIDNYKNGILVDVADEEALAMALNEIILNKNLADKLGKNAKKIRFRLEEEKIINEWENFFEEIINNYNKNK
jgi:glycosyltransferase involved in cell wall biosynthesis